MSYMKPNMKPAMAPDSLPAATPLAAEHNSSICMTTLNGRKVLNSVVWKDKTIMPTRNARVKGDSMIAKKRLIAESQWLVGTRERERSSNFPSSQQVPLPKAGHSFLYVSQHATQFLQQGRLEPSFVTRLR